MNKIEFINNLINNPKLTFNQKKRVFNLIKLELNEFELSEDSILNEIKKIKEKVGIIDEKTTTTIKTQTKPKTSLPKYLSPRNLKHFLKEYNQDPILKYTCHLFDDKDKLQDLYVLTKKDIYSFKEHLKLIRDKYFKLYKKYDGLINQNIKGIIGNYINGPNLKDEKGKNRGWSMDNIKINWSSKSLKKWCEEHPNQVPNPGDNFDYFPFQFHNLELNSTGETINHFSDLVLHFKKMFHVRDDNSLKNMIKRINNLFFKEQANIKVEIPENIEFFTDVDKVKQAYKKIISMCVDYALRNDKEKPNIVLSLKESKNDNSIYFGIHHKNSQFGKTANNTIDERTGDDLTDLIKNQINGVCDLYIEADFQSDEFAKINYWNGKKREIKSLENCVGVKFILKF